MTLMIVRTYDGPHHREALLVERPRPASEPRLGLPCVVGFECQPTDTELLELLGTRQEADQWTIWPVASINPRAGGEASDLFVLRRSF